MPSVSESGCNIVEFHEIQKHKEFNACAVSQLIKLIEKTAGVSWADSIVCPDTGYKTWRVKWHELSPHEIQCAEHQEAVQKIMELDKQLSHLYYKIACEKKNIKDFTASIEKLQASVEKAKEVMANAESEIEEINEKKMQMPPIPPRFPPYVHTHHATYAIDKTTPISVEYRDKSGKKIVNTRYRLVKDTVTF